MKIQKPKITVPEQQSRIKDLQLLLKQPTSKEVRPCSFCNLLCDFCGSTKCTCNCSPECEQVAKEMSSEPDRYPIEPLVLPLVFHLNALRVIETCWSCEGHDDPFKGKGKIWKLPQVWFYSQSVVYPQLINDYLMDLMRFERLNHTWQVSLSYSDDAYATCFVMLPNLCQLEEVSLLSLQRDIKEISTSLENNVRATARYLLQELISISHKNQLKII